MLTSRSFALLSCKSDGFSYPMILSVSGMAFSSLAVAALDKAAPRLVQRPRVSWRQYARTFLPIGALMAVTLALGNIAYLHLSVAMIQILKSLCPCITAVVLFLAGLERQSAKVWAAILVTSLGCAVAVRGDLDYNLLGLIIVIASEIAECCRVVAVQFLIEGRAQGGAGRLRLNAFSSLYYLAPACVFWVGLLILTTGEGARCMEDRCWEKVAQRPWLYLLAASLGFGVNASTFLVIQTSKSGSLTFKAAGTVKNAFIVLFSVLLFGNVVTRMELGGYAIAIGGFLWYQRLKMLEAKNTPHVHGK